MLLIVTCVYSQVFSCFYTWKYVAIDMDSNEQMERIEEDLDFQDRCDIIYNLICDDLYIPMKAKELAILLNIRKGDRHTLHKVLDTLVKRGKIECTPTGKYIKAGNIPSKEENEDDNDDILTMIKAYNVPFEFPTKVLNQATRVAKPVSEADMSGREDFRDITMVTIDGVDAKDLDDAVSLSYDGTYYELGVYIADVANYVQEHSALDREAIKRGTSVYLVDRVIPMLPKELSNGICSLNAGEDRLSMCCIMTIDGKGDIIDHKICEGVINVNYRMTYDDVTAILDGDEELSHKYQDVTPMFQNMYTLSTILRNKRRRRGGIDFDMSETEFVLDDKCNIVDIKPYKRNVASLIIEDFMLAANETVAEDFFWKESAFLYRTHGVPDDDKVRALKALISKFGYVLKGDSKNMHPKEFQKLLRSVEGKEEEILINKLTLRTMQQAKYTPENTGHFGLAAKYYCHFTSPIRRYPDLIIHRIIKDHLRGRYNSKREDHYNTALTDIAPKVCTTERRAVELEREVEKLKKVEYMRKFLGDTFTGIISAVTKFGFFVELLNGVDGLVHVSTLRDDHYNLNEESLELVGERTGRSFSIGDEVTVMLVRADDKYRQIDFELVKPSEV